MGTSIRLSLDTFEAIAPRSIPVSTTKVGAFASVNLRLDFLNGGSGSQVHPYWAFQNLLGSGLTGPLVGYQSTLGPTFTNGFLDGFADFGPSTPGVLTGGFATVPNAISTSAPEPNVALVIGSGVMGLLVWRRKRLFTKASV